MKSLVDIIAQMQSAGITKEKLKEPLVKRLEGVIEDRENIFYFTKSHFGGSNGLVFLTSKGILFVGDRGINKLNVQRIEGERVEDIRFDVQMFNNSSLTIVTKNADFIFESINKEDRHEFMAKYKRYHGIVFGKKATPTSTKTTENSSTTLFTWIILIFSIALVGFFIYAVSQLELDTKKAFKQEREVFLKEGNGNLNSMDNGKVVVGDSNDLDISVGPTFDFSTPETKKQITEVLKAKKPAAKKEEVNKLNDLISRMGKMVVEGVAELTSDERILLKLKGENGLDETIEIKPKDENVDFKELLEYNSSFNKNVVDRFTCSGESKLNNEEQLVLTGCSIR